MPHAEEVSDAPSDTGSPVHVLKGEFGDLVDFDLCEGDWYEHKGEYAIEPKVVNERATKLRKFIRDRAETEVALVSHGFFAHFITGDVDDNGEQTTPWWQETELRSYTFVDGDPNAMIQETEESLKRRGGHKVVDDGQKTSNVPSQRGQTSDGKVPE